MNNINNFHSFFPDLVRICLVFIVRSARWSLLKRRQKQIISYNPPPLHPSQKKNEYIKSTWDFMFCKKKKKIAGAYFEQVLNTIHHK